MGQVECRFPIDLRCNYVLCPATTHVTVPIHGECLATAGLSVDKDRRVEPKHYLLDQKVRPGPPENAFLRRSFIKNLIKGIALHEVVLIGHS